MDTDNKLLKGISSEAQEQSDKILSDAEQRVENIFLQSEHRIKKELEKEDKEFENRILIENLKVKSSKKATQRKVQLSILEKSTHIYFHQLRKRFIRL